MQGFPFFDKPMVRGTTCDILSMVHYPINLPFSLSNSDSQQIWCCAQRITYAKTKSDAVSKAEGTYVENKKERQKHNQEQRGRLSLAEHTAFGSYVCAAHPLPALQCASACLPDCQSLS